MAKKKKENEESVFSPIIEGAKTYVISLVKSMIQEKVKQAEKLGTEIAFLLTFLVIGVFFVLTSIAFLLHEYFFLTYFVSFLSVGIVSLIAAFIIYKMIKKD